jgi:NAD(P)-dependent dehydrogenase (short-subunit alcohol dehydrogenase family)
MLRPSVQGDAMTPNRWRLDGQLALITGASAGIGLAVTRELLGFGADAMLVARDADALETVRDELLDEFPDRSINAMAADVAANWAERARRRPVEAAAAVSSAPTKGSSRSSSVVSRFSAAHLVTSPVAVSETLRALRSRSRAAR